MNKLILLSLFGLLIAGCGKGDQPKVACELEACTYQFVSIIVKFTDKNDNPVSVNNFSAVNQRTGLNLDIKTSTPNPTGGIGIYTLTNDNMLSQFSTEGDNILISGTSTTTNQTKTAIVNIAGGCNCHVDRKSGPETIKFD